MSSHNRRRSNHVENLGSVSYQDEGQQYARENDLKIVEYRGSATRIHQCTEERHSECRFFLHQQVCIPNDSEQERLFHDDEPL